MAPSDEVKFDIKWTLALLVASMLAFSADLASREGVLQPDWWRPYSAGSTGDENMTALTGQFLNGDPTKATFAPGGVPLLVAFEVLSVLLLAALVGAVAIAVRDPDAPGRDRRPPAPPPSGGAP